MNEPITLDCAQNREAESARLWAEASQMILWSRAAEFCGPLLK